MRDDRFFMKKLCFLQKAGWKTSPNPMVGAVIVKMEK